MSMDWRIVRLSFRKLMMHDQDLLLAGFGANCLQVWLAGKRDLGGEGIA